jgi:hypothetical protein
MIEDNYSGADNRHIHQRLRQQPGDRQLRHTHPLALASSFVAFGL